MFFSSCGNDVSLNFFPIIHVFVWVSTSQQQNKVIDIILTKFVSIGKSLQIIFSSLGVFDHFYSNKLPLKLVYSKWHSQSEFNSTRFTFSIFMSIFTFDFLNSFSKIMNKIWLLACHKPSPINKLKSIEYCFCSLFSIFTNPVNFPCYRKWKGLVFLSIFC